MCVPLSCTNVGIAPCCHPGLCAFVLQRLLVAICRMTYTYDIVAFDLSVI
jgi:hypothetical protein